MEIEALARTCNPPSRTGWEAVELWREASSKPENWGSQRVAGSINSGGSEFEGISRSEVQAWVDDGGKPDPAHAIEVARSNGWDADEWTDTVTTLAELVIGVFAFGSVRTDHFVQSWSPDDDESRSAIESALVGAGVGYQHVERDDPEIHADEIRPADHASILGRALVVAGAPVGDKSADSVTGLPDWVHDAPITVRVRLAVLLVCGRGVEHEGKATRTIQTDRGPRYFEDVARLVEDVTGEKATASEHGVTISATAVRELGLA